MPLKETATINLLTPNAILMNVLYFPFLVFITKHGEQLTYLIILMILDFLTGMMKSRKVCKSINRYKFEIGLYMKFITVLLPFIFALAAKGVGYEGVDNWITFSISIFIIIEFYSIIGNCYTIRTGKELEDKDFLSFALLAIRSKAENEISEKLEKIKKKDDKND